MNLLGLTSVPALGAARGLGSFAGWPNMELVLLLSCLKNRFVQG
jgi:hypothetical protein